MNIKVPLTQFFLFILWTLLFVCNVLVKKYLNLNESSKFYGMFNMAWQKAVIVRKLALAIFLTSRKVVGILL
jgi:hypothetical protein